MHSLKALLSAVFNLNGKNFCLRGESEHRSLKLSLLKHSSNHDQYVYTENGSKNHSSRLSEHGIHSKTVLILTCKESSECCHASLLNFHISKMPEQAKNYAGLFLPSTPGENPKRSLCTMTVCFHQ